MTAPWDRRSADEHRRVGELALSRWLPAATSFSVFWMDRAEALEGGAGMLDTSADLARFTPVLEADVRGVGGPGAPALLMRPTEEQVRARADASTLWGMASAIRRDGADGQRRTLLQEYKPVHVHRGGADDDLAIAYSRSDLDRLHRCGARAARVLGLDDADCLVNAVPSGPRLQWWGVYHLALGASLLALHPRGAGDELVRVLDSFDLVPTTVVAVAVDEAVELATLMARHGVEAPRVHTVVVVGPPPDDEVRGEILDAWRAAGATESDLVVRALWAPPEARALWAEPRAEPTGLVTYPDLERLELTDPVTGEVVAEGGDLTITTVGWHGTALLRYQTGVLVDRIDPDPCPASGLTAPRLVGQVVPGAWQPLVSCPDGIDRHFDFRAAAALVEATPRITAWRVELHPPRGRIEHDRVVLEVAGDVTERDLAELGEDIDVAAGAPPNEVIVVDDAQDVQRAVDQHGSHFLDLR